MGKELARIMHMVSNLTKEERHTLLVTLEGDLDRKLYLGIITQEEAWDRYFCLLHECDESGFTEDRARILANIDTKKYNPFKSANPGVVMLARIRCGSGENSSRDTTMN